MEDLHCHWEISFPWLGELFIETTKTSEGKLVRCANYEKEHSLSSPETSDSILAAARRRRNRLHPSLVGRVGTDFAEFFYPSEQMSLQMEK